MATRAFEFHSSSALRLRHPCRLVSLQTSFHLNHPSILERRAGQEHTTLIGSIHRGSTTNVFALAVEFSAREAFCRSRHPLSPNCVCRNMRMREPAARALPPVAVARSGLQRSLRARLCSPECQ